MKRYRLTKLFIHGDEDSMYDDGINEYELSKKAAENFAKSCYELILTVKIDQETGDVFVQEFMHVPLEREVKL